MSAQVGAGSLADRRLVLLLLALFGGVALVLATTGVYGGVAYIALQRTPGIRVRLALGVLGVRGSNVARLLLQQGAAFAVAGISVGIAAAFAATRVLANLSDCRTGNTVVYRSRPLLAAVLT